MFMVGHLIALLGLYGLYKNWLMIGAVVFFIGGYFAKKISISIRSAGIMLLVVSTAYGYHNGYEPQVLFFMFAGFVMACFNSKRTTEGCDWGFDIDFSDTGSGCDGDGGGGD